MTRPAALFQTVAIAGVGLIGGSIGLGIRQRFLAHHVIGLDQNAKVLEAALGMGVIDEAKFNPGKWLAEVDLVILASPAGTIISSAESLQPFLAPDCIVIDVGSVKAGIVSAMSELGINFVGTHPMAGSEKGGVQNASAALLETAMWVLTPDKQTNPQVLSKVKHFVHHLDANPIEIDPIKHDKLVAAVSHVPYLCAVALTQLIASDEDRAEMMLLAAGGFRDVSRVASGSPRMSRDMVIGNRQQVKDILAIFQAGLTHLEKLLDDPNALLTAAEQAKNVRDQIPIVKRSLLPSAFELNVAVPDQAGQLARIATALGDAGVNIRDVEVLDIREEGGALRLNFDHEQGVQEAIKILEALDYEVRRTA